MERRFSVRTVCSLVCELSQNRSGPSTWRFVFGFPEIKSLLRKVNTCFDSTKYEIYIYFVYIISSVIPDKNLVTSILDATEKIKKNYRLSMLNGKMKILYSFDSGVKMVHFIVLIFYTYELKTLF